MKLFTGYHVKKKAFLPFFFYFFLFFFIFFVFFIFYCFLLFFQNRTICFKSRVLHITSSHPVIEGLTTGGFAQYVKTLSRNTASPFFICHSFSRLISPSTQSSETVFKNRTITINAFDISLLQTRS